MAIDKIVRNIVEDNAVTQPKIAAGAVDNTAIDKTIVTGLSELTSVADNDELIIYDASADALKRIDKSNTTALDFPTYTSVSPTTSQTVDGGNITFTITGSGFTTGTNARLISNTGVRLNFDTVTRTNTTTISAVIARSSLLVAQSPYDIQVINGEGLSVVGQNKIDIDTTPLFITGAGSLGSPVEGDTVDIEILARDPDSSSAVTFEIQSGSLPSGLSLVNNSGDSCRIQGTAPAVSADTTSNFTLRAFDSASNTTSRAFSITIENFQLNGLRMDRASTDNMTKSMSDGSSIKGVFSAWVKVDGTSNEMNILSHFQDTNNVFSIATSGSGVYVIDYNSGYSLQLQTNRIMRDPSAWFHLYIAIDRSQATANNRNRMFINGVEETSFSNRTNYSQQTSGSHEDAISMNDGECTMYLGGLGNGNQMFGGYLSDVHWIDGSVPAVTEFGETDSNGVWVPKYASGLSYGTNGFHLDFLDSANLGNDANGGTDLTENNITSIDKVEDTPQNNYATLNPLIPHSTPILYKDGNTIAYDTTSNFNTAFSSIGISTGKWYFEAKTSTNNGFVGICKADGIFPAYTAGVYLGHTDLGTNSWSYYADSGNYFYNGSATSYGNSWTNTDMIGCALDLDNNKLYFSKNGTWQNSGDPTSGATGTGAISITSGTYLFGVTKDNESSEIQCNFGNPPFTISSSNTDGNGYGSFEYAVPSGYYSLNTKNLAQYG